MAEAMMTAMTKLLPIAACLGGLLAATPARAQNEPDGNVKFQSSLLIKKPKPGLPDVKPQPLAWPRLDPGAVFCRTEDDLQHLASRRRGETVEGSVDCQIIKNPTAVSIVQRQGPGMTEVKISTAADTGWTDVWLPDKAPPGKGPSGR
jgi:hypothetical protein